MTHVVVLGTGGTIAGLARDPGDTVGYASAQVGVEALVRSAAGGNAPEIEAEQVAQIDSKDMDFDTWRRLATRVAWHAARPEVAGVVVTHGTDTLEETAWFLARLLPLDKPVLLTGAMRPASARAPDGPGNLADAIALAASGDPAGVHVVFAGSVHAPADVRKVHPLRVDAFASGEEGPIGRVAGAAFERLRPSPATEALGIELLPAAGAPWPWVEIVASGAGIDGRAVRALVAAGVDGLVVAATGNGSMQASLEAALLELRVPALRATRCLDGRTVEAERASPGVPSAPGLTPAKARVELLLQLLARRPRG